MDKDEENENQRFSRIDWKRRKTEEVGKSGKWKRGKWKEKTRRGEEGCRTDAGGVRADENTRA